MDVKTRARVALVASLLVVAAGPVWAQSGILLETCEIISTIVRWLVGVGYTAGTIGFALLSIKTAGSGRFSSGSFLSLMGGMFLLGALPAFMAFLLNDTFSYTC
jgi:hypothetical protein